MKIIYLHQYFKFPNESGGTRSFDLATGFINHGYKIEVLALTSNTLFKNNKRWNKIEKKGLVVHYIFLPYDNKMNFFKRALVFFQFLYFSTLKLLSLDGDLVIATSTPLTVGIPSLIKKWLHKTPYIFEIRDVWPEAVIAIGAIKNKILQKLLFFLEHLIYKNAEALVPLSTDMQKSIISRYPKLIRKQIIVIENISEINRFQNTYNKNISMVEKIIGYKPRFTILYAGTFGFVNGINYVLEFAEKLFYVDPSIIFILIGEGIEKQKLIDQALERRILNKNVYILDSIPKNNLPQLYFESDMGSSFVIPIKELWSNSANKFFDTLAAGKPILINYGGWQKEIIHKENIGYTMPIHITSRDVKKFFEYTQNKSLIAKQKENALNIATNCFATDIALKKYNKIVKDILKIKSENT